MSWNENHYRFDNNGNFKSASEAKSAADNGDLVTLSNGNYWDRETNTDYYSDGTRKDD